MNSGRYANGTISISPNYRSYNDYNHNDVICLVLHRDKEIDREGFAASITLNEAKYIRDCFDKILTEVSNGF